MPNYIEPIEKLIRQFTKLPGVGSKTAQRYALTVLSMTDEEAKVFAQAVVDAKEKVTVCSVCGNYTDKDPCHICQTRDRSTICVVQEAKDVIAVELIGEYLGVYHVMGGVLNPLKGIGREDIRLAELFQRLTGDVQEVILATDTSAEGEATAPYIARFVKQYGIKVTRLAQGISIGSELQYADEVTLSRAFSNRKEI